MVTGFFLDVMSKRFAQPSLLAADARIAGAQQLRRVPDVMKRALQKAQVLRAVDAS